MDNLTHSLTGYLLAETGLCRVSPKGVALLILSANAPDLDILALMRGSFRYFEAHRGYSHSFLALPLLALFVVAVINLISRQRLPWMHAWSLCCLGVASHLMLDWTNSYGVRLLLPFSSRWFHLDLNSLYDGWILAALMLGTLLPSFVRLVSNEIGERSPSGRRIAISALIFFCLFDIARSILHGRAVAQLQSRLFENETPIGAAAFPKPFNPFEWNGVVQTERVYVTVPVNALRQLDVQESRTYFKPPKSEIQAAKQEEVFRYFSYFAQYPVWSITPITTDDGENKRIELTDLRFGVPGGGGFHCVAVQDAGGRILDSWFTYGSGAELGRGK